MNRTKGIFITLGLVVAIAGGTLVFKNKTKTIETSNTPETVVSDASTNTDSEETTQDTEDSSGPSNKTNESDDNTITSEDRTNPVTEYEVTDDGYERVKKISESEAIALCDKRLLELDSHYSTSAGSVINILEDVYYQVVYPDVSDAYAVHMYTGEVFYSARDGISKLN